MKEVCFILRFLTKFIFMVDIFTFVWDFGCLYFYFLFLVIVGIVLGDRKLYGCLRLDIFNVEFIIYVFDIIINVKFEFRKVFIKFIYFVFIE